MLIQTGIYQKTAHYYLPLIFIFLLFSGTNAYGNEWLYTVHADDTLWDIADEYLIKETQYTEKLRMLNHITDPEHIPPGTRIRIPIQWMKQQPAPVIVFRTLGNNHVITFNGLRHNLIQGEKLNADDTVVTGENANATLEFADGSRLLIQSRTEVVLDTVSVYGNTGMVDTRLRLQSGYVDTQVKAKKGPGSRYEIITPSAIAAVRGTDFRVSAEANAQIMRSEVIEGDVLVTNDTATQTIQEGFGLYVKKGDKLFAPVRLLPAIDKATLPDTLEFLPLKLKWPKLADAQHYRIQIAPNYRFEELLLDRVVNKPEISFSDLADGDYALRIRGIDRLRLEGLNSVHFFTVNARPEAPMPLNPKDASNVYEPEPKLWWSVPELTEKFHLQVSTDSEFKKRLIDKGLLKESFFIPERPMALGKYYWRVASYDKSGAQGPYFYPQSFVIKEKPATPETRDPSLDETKINFQWRADPDAAKYQFQLADDSGFKAIKLDKQVKENSYSLPFTEIDSGNYYFRVKTINAEGASGDFSKTQKIEIPGGISPYWSGLLLLMLIPILL